MSAICQSSSPLPYQPCGIRTGYKPHARTPLEVILICFYYNCTSRDSGQGSKSIKSFRSALKHRRWHEGCINDYSNSCSAKQCHCRKLLALTLRGSYRHHVTGCHKHLLPHLPNVSQRFACFFVACSSLDVLVFSVFFLFSPCALGQ